MAIAHNEFGQVRRFNAEAIGAPGQRRFRLVVEATEGSANLWLDKEQLYQLAVVLREVLDSKLAKGASRPGEEQLDPRPTEGAALDFQVGSVGLHHDEEEDRFLLLIQELGKEGEQAELSFWASRSKIDEFSQEALKVYNAGRPRCPLCSAPIDPQGHVCPKANGNRMPPA